MTNNNILNKKFNKLTVLYKSNQKDKSGNYLFFCECDCGGNKLVSKSHLKGSYVKSCGCLQKKFTPKNKNREDVIFKKIFKKYKESSEKRNLNFNLCFENFIILIKQPCYYCGKENSNFTRDPEYHKKQKNGTNLIIYHNGLDRVNSSKSYESDNIVPCCKYCNIAKNTMARDEFKQWVINVYNKFTNE